MYFLSFFLFRVSVSLWCLVAVIAAVACLSFLFPFGLGLAFFVCWRSTAFIRYYHSKHHQIYVKETNQIMSVTFLYSIFFPNAAHSDWGSDCVCECRTRIFIPIQTHYRHMHCIAVLTGPYMLCTNKRKTVCVSLSLRFHVYRPFGIRLPHSSVHLILFGVLLLSISQISHSPLVLWLWTFSSLLLFRSSMCIDRVLWWCVEHTYLFGSVFFVVAGVVCILCSLLSTVRSWFENISVCFNSFGICFRGDAKHTNEQRHKHNKKETNQQQHGPPKKKHTPNPKKKNRNWANASAMIIITSLCYLVHVVYLYQLLLCVAQELNMWLFWNKAHFRFETRSSDNRIDCPNSLVCANFLTIVISR